MATIEDEHMVVTENAGPFRPNTNEILPAAGAGPIALGEYTEYGLPLSFLSSLNRITHSISVITPTNTPVSEFLREDLLSPVALRLA
jgi:hypothetical protein